MPPEGHKQRIIAGRYRLVDALGAGAQGSVHLAEDLGRGGAAVALKLVQDVVGGAREEPADAILRHFRHPNWAAILDAGRDGHEGWFQAVELVRGRSLDKLEGPQSPELVWQWLEDGARVLGAMHRQGLLHYDVTPGNVMLDDTGATPRFVLTDGGLAHVGPIQGVARGTPQYMAPEVTEVGEHDHRADLYSLGLVAFRLATGRDPIEGAGSEVLGRRRREDAPLASSLRPDLPPALDALLGSILSRDPRARPHDAFELLDRIAEARNTEIARFTDAEGVAAAEGGAFVGGVDAMARLRASLDVLAKRCAAGTSRVAAIQAPKLREPVLVVTGRSGSGATRLSSEGLDLARAEGVPALLMSGREGPGDRRGPLRRLLDGMAALGRAPDEDVTPIHLDLSRRRPLDREERSHAITRAVEQFVLGVEQTSLRTPFVLVVQDFSELTERAQEAIRVLARHLLALADQGGSAAAPPVLLVVDVGDADSESLLLPDAEPADAPLVPTAPLSRAEILTFLSARFPGIAPDETDLDRIETVSEGLPGALAALLAEGIRRGDLTYETGRWSWNVDALDEYEIRTGLSPTLAQALADADEPLRRLLAYLSLVEAPLEDSIVKRLWEGLSSTSLPNSPLISCSTNGDRVTYALSSRSVAHCANRLANTDDCKRLLQAMGSAGGRRSSEHTLARARLLNRVGRKSDAVRALHAAWPGLSSAARMASQRLLATWAKCPAESMPSGSDRDRAAEMIEFGELASEIASNIAGAASDVAGEQRALLKCARALWNSRDYQSAQKLTERLIGEPDVSDDVLAKAHVMRAQLLFRQHMDAEARLAARDSGRILRRLRKDGRRLWHARAQMFMVLAQSRFLAGHSSRALMSLRAAKQCAKHAHAPLLRAQILSNMGIVTQRTGHFGAAIEQLEASLTIRRKTGDLNGTIATLQNLGRVYQKNGSLVKSAAVLQEAVGYAQRHAQARAAAESLLYLGRVFDQQMNSRLAATTLQRAARTSLRINFARGAAQAAWELAPLSAALGDLETCAQMLSLSSNSARHGVTNYARAMHSYVSAMTYLHLGRDDMAAKHARRAVRRSDFLYEEARESLAYMCSFFKDKLNVSTGTPGRRPQRGCANRYAYRTALLYERLKRGRANRLDSVIQHYLPRAGALSTATGSERRLLAEVVVRSELTIRATGESALAATERYLALSGERYLQGRVLATRSMSRTLGGTSRAAMLFSRSIELLDVTAPAGLEGRLTEPHELRAAKRYHSESLNAAPSAISEAHALAHQALLRHGLSAAPDDRISNALRRVLAATGRMNAGAGLDDLLQGLTEDTIEITGAERACVVLIDANSTQQMRVEKGVSSENLGIEVEDLSQTVIQRVIDSREPLLMHDVFDDRELMGRPSITSLSLRSILCVPMLRGDSLFGVLYADSASAAGSFDSVDQEVLSLFAEQAAAALDTHRLVADVQNSMAELKAMQERLVRGERLRTMGELSSGVAHEFNNLLTSILARVQLISLEPLNGELKRDLELIEKACLDAAEVVRRLQSFTRREREGDFTRVDLHEICRDAVEFLRPLWSTRRRHGRGPITVKLRADHGLPVHGNPTELREVVTNLLKNSLDALADGGEILIEASAIPGGVQLRVVDDGPGIPEDVQARVFDPFFTTKGERGTGLGLCLSQQIIERHGGTMALWSEPGEGTRFTIELPIAAARPGLSGAPRTEEEKRTPTAHVLVVDDDENVRVPLCRFLERSGYEVTSAVDGTDALRKAHEHRPDVLISDVAMPGMDGITLCERAREDLPGLPVILMSGWAHGNDPARGRRAGAARLLKKPFALQQVEAELRDVLGLSPRHDASLLGGD